MFASPSPNTLFGLAIHPDLIDPQAVRKSEVSNRLCRTVFVFEQQSSGEKVPSADVGDEVIVEDVLAGDIELLSDNVRGKSPRRGLDGRAARTGVETVLPLRDVQEAALHQDGEAGCRGDVEVDPLLANVLVAEEVHVSEGVVVR